MSSEKKQDKELSEQEAQELLSKILQNPQGYLDSMKNQKIGDQEESLNEVITLRLVSCQADLIESDEYKFQFNPYYTHQLFGEENGLSGYTDPRIVINFTSGSLFPYLKVHYASKQKSANVENYFEDFFVSGYTKERGTFLKKLNEEKHFKPPGVLLKEYERNGGKFQMYKCDHSIEGFTEFKLRAQVFTKFLIETANYVTEEENWRYLVIFQVCEDTQTLKFVGFANYYKFNLQHDLLRYRISQILVLPCFQKQGHGYICLDSIYQEVKSDETCFELCVEDCSDDFQFIRDLFDCRLTFPKLTLHKQETSQKTFQKSLAQEFKLARKQVKRICEMFDLNERLRTCACEEEREKGLESFKKQLIETVKLEQDLTKTSKRKYICINGKVMSNDILQKAQQKKTLVNADKIFEDIGTNLVESYDSLLKKLNKN